MTAATPNLVAEVDAKLLYNDLAALWECRVGVDACPPCKERHQRVAEAIGRLNVETIRAEAWRKAAEDADPVIEAARSLVAVWNSPAVVDGRHVTYSDETWDAETGLTESLATYDATGHRG